MITGRPGTLAEMCAPLVARLFSFFQRTSERHRRSLRVRLQLTRATDEAGFTLVEVIVALAMLSVGLSILLGMVSNGLNRTASAEKMAEAGSLAQSLLAEVGADLAIKPEERSGQYPNGYRWRVKMLPYGDPAAREERPVELYQISAEIEWGEGAEQRSFALSTLRLGPRAVRR
jgi:general secretion pathway protein I